MPEITESSPLSGDLAHIVRRRKELHAEAEDIACDVLPVFERDPKLLNRVQKTLEKMGYRHFDFVGSGTWAIALLSSDNQIIRIQAEEPILTNERIECPGVLKAIRTCFVKADPAPEGEKPARDIRIEVLPRLRTEGVTIEQKKMLMKAIVASNLQVNDLFKEGNVGIMEVGGKEVPLLIDVGLLRINNPRERVTIKPEHWKEWQNEDGVALQDWIIIEEAAKLSKLQGVSGSFSEVMAKCIEHNWPKRCAMVSNFESEPSMQAAVEKKLNSLGFRHFEYVGKGVKSVALHSTENQVLRISIDERNQLTKRPLLPGILQPIATHIVKYGAARVRVEILPRVRTEGVKQEHIDMLREALLRSGYHVGDIDKPGNVGLIDMKRGSIPVLVDPGLMVPYDAKKSDNDLHWKPWLNEKGAWLQSCNETRTAATGVITDRTLAKLDKRMRGPKSWREKIDGMMHGTVVDSRPVSQTVEAIKTDGLYTKQVDELYQRAMLKHDDTTNFSEVLRQERTLMQDEMKR